MNTTDLKNRIEKIIAEKGAAIVAFDYNGKRRNGLIGYKPFGERKWGTHTGKAIVVSETGEEFLTVKTNNEDTPDGHAFKSFALAKIENFTHKGVTL